MPRMQKRPFVEPIRRKCEDTGTVKQVNYKYYYIPPFDSQGGTKLPTYTPKTRKNRSEIPGVVVKYYHTLEGAEAAHGEGSFTNNYTEDDFLRA
tara:strand:+ start:173 stop:454 length:282 start_codon:yes stop_codon:yes gene_type:complete